MDRRFPASVDRALANATDEARRLGHDFVGPAHLLLGLIGAGDLNGLLAALGVDANRLVNVLEGSLPVGKGTRWSGKGPPFTSWTMRALKFATEEAGNGSELQPLHLVLGTLRCPGSLEDATSPLGLTAERVRVAVSGQLVPPPPAVKETASWFLELDPELDSSLFDQIVAKIEEAVATGRLTRGERLPSVRQLAAELTVAPGTVARAYSILESRGVLVTDGARGTRVASELKGLPGAAERVATLEGLLRPLVITAHHLGASVDEVRTALERTLKRVGGTDAEPT